jgi:hypothetical protein
MQRARETGKTPQVRAARRALVGWSGALCILALLSGCNWMPRNKGPSEGEPLYGEFHKQTFTPAPPPGKTTSSKSGNSGAVPNFPNATSTASIGSIAGEDPMMGSHPLGIPSTGTNKNQTAASQGMKLASAQSSDGMSPGLRAPIVEALPAAPSASGLPAAGAVAPPPPWTNRAAQVSYEQLQQMLMDRGMSEYRQETYQGGVKFTCWVPNPYNRDFRRTYEATARDYKSALLAVIDQIDRDRQQR